MSKFIDNLKASLGYHQRPARRHSIIDVTVDMVPQDLSFTPMRTYNIEAAFRVSGYCLPQDLEKLKANAAKQIVEEMYGDFRGQLLLLERLLYEEDIEQAKKVCSDLQIKVRV